MTPIELSAYLDAIIERDDSDCHEPGDNARHAAEQRRLAHWAHAEMDSYRYPYDPEHDPHARQRTVDLRAASRAQAEQRAERRRAAREAWLARHSGGLPRRELEVALLWWVHGVSHAEAARLLRLAPGSLRCLRHRLVGRLPLALRIGG